MWNKWLFKDHIKRKHVDLLLAGTEMVKLQNINIRTIRTIWRVIQRKRMKIGVKHTIVHLCPRVKITLVKRVYYPAALRRVQITLKTSTSSICTPEDRLESFLPLTNQLAWFPAPIPFRFAYFYHAFPVNKYPRNSLARTYQFGVLDNKSLIRRFVV